MFNYVLSRIHIVWIHTFYILCSVVRFIQSVLCCSFQSRKRPIRISIGLQSFHLGHIQTMRRIFIRNPQLVLESQDFSVRGETFPITTILLWLLVYTWIRKKDTYRRHWGHYHLLSNDTKVWTIKFSNLSEIVKCCPALDVKKNVLFRKPFLCSISFSPRNPLESYLRREHKTEAPGIFVR